MAGRPARKQMAERAILAYQALTRKTGVTCCELRRILDYQDTGYGSDTAMRWIDAYSFYLPVTEIGTRRNGDSVTGPKAIVYGILK